MHIILHTNNPISEFTAFLLSQMGANVYSHHINKFNTIFWRQNFKSMSQYIKPDNDIIVNFLDNSHEQLLEISTFLLSKSNMDYCTVSFLASIFGAIVITNEALYGNDINANLNISLLDVASYLNGLSLGLIISPEKKWNSLQWAFTPFVNNWLTKDNKFIYVHLALTNHFTKFLNVLEKTEFSYIIKELKQNISQQTLADPTKQNSIHEAKIIYKFFTNIFKQKTVDEWEQLLKKYGFCAEKILTLTDWCNSEHALKAKYVKKTDDNNFILGENILPSNEIKNVLTNNNKNKIININFTHYGNSLIKKTDIKAKVLDFSSIIAGPVAGKTFAELGAELNKIDLLKIKQEFIEPFDLFYHDLKTNIVFNHEPLKEIIQTHKSNIIIDNLPSGSQGIFGLGLTNVKEALNDKGVYINISAFGAEGPLARNLGFEQTIQAITGIQYNVNPQKPNILNVPLCDMGTGLFSLWFGLAAHQVAQAENKVCYLRNSLVQTATIFQFFSYDLKKINYPIKRINIIKLLFLLKQQRLKKIIHQNKKVMRILSPLEQDNTNVKYSIFSILISLAFIKWFLFQIKWFYFFIYIKIINR